MDDLIQVKRGIMYQFDFSKDHIKKTNRNMMLFFPFLTLCLVGFTLFITDYKVNKVLIPLGVTFLIMGAIVAIEIPLMNRSSRRMKVLLYDNEIIKQCGKNQQKVLWDNIIKMKLIENTKGGITCIRLYQKNKKTIQLFGFNGMENIADLIRQRISDNVLVETKRYRLDWENPIIPIMTGIATMIILCIVASGGAKAMDIFVIVFSLFVGILLLVCRPLTKFNLSIRWFEIIGAVFLIIMGIYGFVVFIITGKLP